MEFIPSDDADLSGIYQDHDLGSIALENRSLKRAMKRRRRAGKKKLRKAARREKRQQPKVGMYSRMGERMAQRQAARQQRKAARQAHRQERRALKAEKKFGKGVELGPRRRKRPMPRPRVGFGTYQQPSPDFMAQRPDFMAPPPPPPLRREFRRRRRMKRIGGPGARPPKSGLPAYLTPKGQASHDLPEIAYQTEQSIPQASVEFTEVGSYSGNIGIDHYGMAMSNSRRLVRRGGLSAPGRAAKRKLRKANKARRRAGKKGHAGQRPTAEQLAKLYEQSVNTFGKDHPRSKKLLRLHRMASRPRG